MGFLKFDVQGAIMDAVGGALSKVAKSIDLDNDGRKDLEEQLMPMGKKLADGAQEVVDSIDIPALAANAMIVAGDVQQLFADGRAMLTAVDLKKAQHGATAVSESVGGLVTYATKAIAAQQK